MKMFFVKLLNFGTQKLNDFLTLKKFVKDKILLDFCCSTVGLYYFHTIFRRTNEYYYCLENTTSGALNLHLVMIN
jgi:hypothetical protein